MLPTSITTARISHSQSRPDIPAPDFKRIKYIKVVNGRKRKPRQGQIHEPNAASKAAGRAIHTMTRKSLDKPATKLDKQPVFVRFILILLSVYLPYIENP